MLSEFWELHRKKIFTAVGAAIFLASGAAVSFLPSTQKAETTAQVQRETERYAQPQGTKDDRKKEAGTVQLKPYSPPQPAMSNVENKLTVYITGYVKNPGVYHLPINSRIETLIGAAGGFREFADVEAVNIVEPLRDGAHVHIPYKWAPQNKKVSNSATSPKSKAKPRKNNERVDINRADEETLTKLRGIGPILARRIVEYRQAHGPFRSVDELINVTGIGRARLDGLRSQAFVNP